MQIQNEHSYENGEHTVGERAQPLRGPSRMARLSSFQEIADALSNFAGVRF